MPLKQTTGTKASLKLNTYPHADMDLRILEAPITRLKELMTNVADSISTHATSTEKPSTSADRALEEYLTSGDDGHTESSFHYNPDQDNSDDKLESLAHLSEKLSDHLLRQLHILDLPPPDRDLAECLIGNIDDNGFLRYSLEEIAQQQNADQKHAEQMLFLIQTFEPTGIAARDLKECLLLQLKAHGKENSIAFQLVSSCLPLLEKKQFANISRQLDIPEASVKKALEEIARLQPRPGQAFAARGASFIVPDARIENTDAGPELIMNNDDLPVLTISPAYRRMLKDPETPAETCVFIRDRIKAARALISAISRRQHTLRQIINAIVDAQQDFLTQPDAPLKPMTLQQIALATEKDISTISRAVHQKYLQTPRRTIELRTLFHGGIEQASHIVISSEEIKSKIRTLIDQENKTDPLSDQAISDLLQPNGVAISRRTITKYREEMRILPSLSRRK